MTWHVGAIVNEPEPVILRFAAWYFQAGAQGMTLFFDDPEDPAIATLEAHPDITCIRCTPAFWEGLGVAADTRFTRRQNLALTWLYQQAPAAWLLNVDADEFMYFPGQGIEAFLRSVAPEVEGVRVETAEILQTDQPGPARHYRMPVEREAARRIYGPSAKFFGPRRKGLVGHPQGKSFVRTGLEDVSLRQHWAQRSNGENVAELHVKARSGNALLHHIGEDYDTWKAKLPWRVGASGFTVPLSETLTEIMAGPDADAALRKIYEDLHAADAPRLANMRAEQALMSVPVGPDDLASALLD